MKKLAALFFVVVVLCLAACSVAPPDDELISKTSKSGGVAPSSKDLSSDAFQIINNERMNCSTDNGYYYLTNGIIRLKDGTVAHHMMYLDYGLKKEIYLCNRPGCGHDTTECPAVFTEKEVDMGGSMFVHENFLYLFSHEQDRDGSSYHQPNSGGSSMQEGAPSMRGTTAVLYRMNLDGTDRKQVYTFDGALALENMVIGGEQALYFITKKLAAGQVDNQIEFISSTERTLVQLNTKTWKLETVGLMKTDTKIIGTFDGSLITSQIVFDHELSKAEQYNEDAYLEAYKNSETHLAFFDPVSGESEVLLKLPNKNLNSYAVHNRELYVSTEGEGQIWQVDLKTKKKTKFAQTASSLIRSVHQDVLMCSDWETQSGEDALTVFIQFDSGKIGQSRLVTSSLKSPIEIRAEARDFFLVIYDIDAEIDTAYDNGQYTVNGYKYALLGKEDLYQGRGNYQPVEMIGFGE